MIRLLSHTIDIPDKVRLLDTDLESASLKRGELLNKYFPIIITLIYSISVIFGMYYHELWRDELDIYARVFYNGFLKYNGTSGLLEFSYLLYYNVLHIIITLIPNYSIFQAFHLILIAIAIYIFNRYSPFNMYQKIFFTFSYFMLFEYGIISRWYGLFVLLVFIITYLLTREKKNYIVISILLLILANHNISSAIFAASLALYAIIHIFNCYPFNNWSVKEKNHIIIASTIFTLGSILLLLQYTFVFIHQGKTFEYLGHAPFFMSIRTIWNTYIPIPDFSNGAAFWNTNFFHFPIIFPQTYNIYSFITPGNIFTSLMSIIIILSCIIIFSKKLPVLFIFLFNTIAYFVFIHFIFRAYFIRHQGLLFIIFVYCCWLYKYSDKYIKIPFTSIMKPIGKDFESSKYINLLFTCLVTIIFIFQFIAGILTYSKSIHYQFTKSWETADYIRQNNYQDHVIVGAIDYAVLPIAIILDRDIYFPQTDRTSKILEYWGVNRNPNVDLNELLKKSIYFQNYYNRKVLIILNSELTDMNNAPITAAKVTESNLLKKIKSFEGDIIQPDEQYYLYELIKIH